MSRRSLNRICGIIDFDGFHVGREFLVREFGFIAMKRSSRIGKSKRYDLRPFSHLITERNARTIRYVTDKILGLPFHPLRGEYVYALEDLDDHILDFYERCKTPRRKVIAYKGGEVEKERLDDLEIPSVNLEIYGCPPFNELQNRRYDEISCGYHKRYLHCPRAEVTAFKDWICENYY